MNYHLIKDVIGLIQQFETERKKSSGPDADVTDFRRWVAIHYTNESTYQEPTWEGKEKGRSAESVINTLIVHLNRYAKNYSRSAIFDSDFSSQEDFIYLINLKASGQITKMDLIKKNVHDKPAGMQIISRLIAQGWVKQTESKIDKRSRVLNITKKGIMALTKQMVKIRKASKIVTGDLMHSERMELIRLLQKLNDFHRPIYDQNIEAEHLLDEALKNLN